MVDHATIVHVVSSRCTAEQLRRLNVLRDGLTQWRHVVVQTGAGPLAAKLVGTRRGHAPLPLRGLREGVLLRQVQACSGNAQKNIAVWHVWSPDALDWLGFNCVADGRLFVELDYGVDVRRSAERAWAVGAAREIVFRCSDQSASNELERWGVMHAQRPVGRPVLEVREAKTSDRAQLRRRLYLAPDDLAVLAVPPITSGSGAFTAAWATLLLEKVNPAARLVLSLHGEDAQRTARLVRACRHQWMVRYAGAEWTAAQLAAVCDVAAFLPDRPAPPHGALEVLSCGGRLVTTEWGRRLLPDAASVQQARVGDPEDVARALRRALDSENRHVRDAAMAIRAYAHDHKSLLAEYAGLYGGRRCEQMGGGAD